MTFPWFGRGGGRGAALRDVKNIRLGVCGGLGRAGIGTGRTVHGWGFGLFTRRRDASQGVS